jgi:hypothetical protein
MNHEFKNRFFFPIKEQLTKNTIKNNLQIIKSHNSEVDKRVPLPKFYFRQHEFLHFALKPSLYSAVRHKCCYLFTPTLELNSLSFQDTLPMCNAQPTDFILISFSTYRRNLRAMLSVISRLPLLPDVFAACNYVFKFYHS